VSTEVLLLSNIKDLGAEGEVVTVADGYARNYLLPKNLGAPVTEATRRRLAKLQADRENAVQLALEAAQAMAARVTEASCTIAVKSGPDDKLFGSVTAQQIAENLKAQGIALDRHALSLEEPIRELGVFNVPVKLHPDVQATLRVWVVEE